MSSVRIVNEAMLSSYANCGGDIDCKKTSDLYNKFYGTYVSVFSISGDVTKERIIAAFVGSHDRAHAVSYIQLSDSCFVFTDDEDVGVDPNVLRDSGVNSVHHNISCKTEAETIDFCDKISKLEPTRVDKITVIDWCINSLKNKWLEEGSVRFIKRNEITNEYEPV